MVSSGRTLVGTLYRANHTTTRCVITYFARVTYILAAGRVYLVAGRVHSVAELDAVTITCYYIAYEFVDQPAYLLVYPSIR